MSDFYAFALTFASEHWFLTWCALWLLWVPLMALRVLGVLVTRLYRCVKVGRRPAAQADHDADGDWKPEPKKE